MQERPKKERKSPKNRSKRRLRHYVLSLGLFLGAVGLWFTAGASYGRLKVLYKEARPKKELTKSIEKSKKDTYDRGNRVDPFASYLVKREQVLMDLEKARREKLSALVRVYVLGEQVSAVCRDLRISRQTWYRWEKEFRIAIGRIWGGLKRIK